MMLRQDLGPWLLTVLCATVVLWAVPASANITLPRLISDAMILQRDCSNRIWGWADEGEAVALEFNGRELAHTKTVNDRFEFLLPPQPAGGPHQLRLKGNNEVLVSDILFGDVWLASGQSNMVIPMERVKEKFPDAIAGAFYPEIREFTVARQADFNRAHDDVPQGSWRSANPESVLNFSAVAFFFARELNERYGVPIGIVNSSYGGSTAEGWMSENALKAFPEHLAKALHYRDENTLKKIQASDQASSDLWYGNINRNDKGLQENPNWSAENFDHSHWPTMALPGFWADRGVAPINGVIWFRRQVNLERLPVSNHIKLMLGRIVDADEVYVNGVKIGNTTYQYPPRRYTIPKGLLKVGSNVIAVRVISTNGKGGFVTDKPYWLEWEDVDGETEGETTHIDLRGPWQYQIGVSSAPLPPSQFQAWLAPLGFYNAMLAPLKNTEFKGILWYQGESNSGRPKEYAKLLTAMIRDWRALFAQGNKPFLIVQLASYLQAQENPIDSQWAETRAAQASALSESNTALVTAIDVGEWNDIHPLDKKTVGERLALAARKLAYGEKNVVAAGPTAKRLEKVKANPHQLRITFDNVGSGLVAHNGSLEGFAIANAQGDYVWAKAKIENATVVVWSDEIQNPQRVRYAWADNPDRANLYNAEGLPAFPFQLTLK